MREGNGGRETASSRPGASPRIAHEVPCHHFVDERSQVLTDLCGGFYSSHWWPRFHTTRSLDFPTQVKVPVGQGRNLNSLGSSLYRYLQGHKLGLFATPPGPSAQSHIAVGLIKEKMWFWFWFWKPWPGGCCWLEPIVHY